MGRRITGEQLNKMTTAQLKTYINRTAKKANRDLRAFEHDKIRNALELMFDEKVKTYDNRKFDGKFGEYKGGL